MAKILLDYAFPITVVTPTPAASTAFLKQVCVVAKPASGQEANVGTVYECVTMAEVEARTANTNAQQLFNAGMAKVYVLLANDLDLETPLTETLNDFFTVLISDDFVDADIDPTQATLTQGNLTFTAKNTGSGGNGISVELLDTGTAGSEAVTVTDEKISVSIEGGVSTATQIKTAIDASTAAMALIDPVSIASGQESTAQAAFAETNLAGGDGLFVGPFEGVVGYSTTSQEVASDFAAVENQCAFFTDATNKAKNMFYAFGSLLSNASDWKNQQFISMPFNDGVESLGTANSLFDDKISFVIHDDEFANRLAMFACGGVAIVAPYILKHLRVNMQSRALSYISANQPQYNLKEAALLEARLVEDVINVFIAQNWITEGTVSITLVEDNFVANGDINVAQPNALWRVVGEMQQTL